MTQKIEIPHTGPDEAPSSREPNLKLASNQEKQLVGILSTRVDRHDPLTQRLLEAMHKVNPAQSHAFINKQLEDLEIRLAA